MRGGVAGCHCCAISAAAASRGAWQLGAQFATLPTDELLNKLAMGQQLQLQLALGLQAGPGALPLIFPGKTQAGRGEGWMMWVIPKKASLANLQRCLLTYCIIIRHQQRA